MTESALLNVGHPEQADVPPVPSQRPSPGQVPAKWALAWLGSCGFCFCCWCSDGEAAGVGMAGGEPDNRRCCAARLGWVAEGVFEFVDRPPRLEGRGTFRDL